MINIKKTDYILLKTFLDLQILIEDLDEINNNIQFNEIKQKSNHYLNWIEREIVPIINTTFHTNPKLFEELLNNIRIGSKENEKLFNIIQ